VNVVISAWRDIVIVCDAPLPWFSVRGVFCRVATNQQGVGIRSVASGGHRHRQIDGAAAVTRNNDTQRAHRHRHQNIACARRHDRRHRIARRNRRGHRGVTVTSAPFDARRWRHRLGDVQAVTWRTWRIDQRASCLRVRTRNQTPLRTLRDAQTLRVCCARHATCCGTLRAHARWPRTRLVRRQSSVTVTWPSRGNDNLDHQKNRQRQRATPRAPHAYTRAQQHAFRHTHGVGDQTINGGDDAYR